MSYNGSDRIIDCTADNVRLRVEKRDFCGKTYSIDVFVLMP